MMNLLASIIAYGLIGFMLLVWASALVLAGLSLADRRYRHQRARRRSR